MLTKCVFVVPVFIPTIFSEMSLVKIQLLISEMKVWTCQRHRVCFVFYTTLYLLHLFDHFGPGLNFIRSPFMSICIAFNLVAPSQNATAFADVFYRAVGEW